MPSKPASSKPAVDTAIAEKKGKGFGSITFEEVEYGIERKPNTLLISELARTGSGDPEAISVLAEFFAATLGSNYAAFKKATYRSDDVDETVLFGLLGEILEKTLGRPTV